MFDNLLENPISFDDNGEYEVDECHLRHVRVGRRKYYKDIWIGGILERVTGMVLLYQLPDKTRTSMIPPIQDNVPHGSFIYSDEYVVYRSLTALEYSHFSVNHSKKEYACKEIVGGEDINIHINTLEGVNHEIRQHFSNKSSRNTERVNLILAEIMYRHSGRSLFSAFKI